MDELVRQEKALSAEIEDCGKKLIRAEKMIGGLKEKRSDGLTLSRLLERSSLFWLETVLLQQA